MNTEDINTWKSPVVVSISDLGQEGGEKKSPEKSTCTFFPNMTIQQVRELQGRKGEPLVVFDVRKNPLKQD